MPKEKILIIGANGQIGTGLTKKLRDIHGHDCVIASDIHLPTDGNNYLPFEILDATDASKLSYIIERYRINQIYHLAAIMSGKSELNPLETWNVNMDGLFNVLEAAQHYKIKKVFFSSTIAVFGSNTPRVNTPQDTIRTPETVLGMSKVAGENWCSYYHKRYGVDVRGIRFPGIIGAQASTSGNVTDYAIDMLHKAVEGESYDCYLKPQTRLPMIYMGDVIRSIVELMDAPTKNITIRSSYNVNAITCSPADIYEAIKVYIPNFEVHFKPDSRQTIAETFPESVDDSTAQKDWHWTPQYDLPKTVERMIEHLMKIYNVKKMV
ncbi:MAG: NAD-dependent epimerase/dehydratase family protein [Saprospiraceae bacterium]|nr:NAD-dependent epimerase/dehydratase family protein [Saprospiraceae bacterium]